MKSLPFLIAEDLIPTRNYLQEVAKVLGSLQMAYIEPNEHDWHYGLEVNLRGISTQEMMIGGEPVRATLDLVRHKVRIGDAKWPLSEYAASEIFNNIKVWLAARGESVDLKQPVFNTEIKRFDPAQASAYAEALWWLEERFRATKSGLNVGLTSPILLYPHHFDMAFSWFPQNDKKQFTLGFSTGDEINREPYLYLTVTPDSEVFNKLKLPAKAHWQEKGFIGAILAYAWLQVAEVPTTAFDNYAALMLEA